MATSELPKRLEGWREEQIDFLAQLVNQDSGTHDRANGASVRALVGGAQAEIYLGASPLGARRRGAG
jgi:hypothetical protein